ncbi:hypothetical protein CQY20_30500 [Mycolicibacterium agri]|uniref:Membrane protein n=1 Tax=Mycolicibacterium agri TaxID=36811 RepID=A0A2A7MPP7_MYCAG|nr:AbrB family transcriptional regulator [Mycolicibacterium agri]PEG33487.1 hypothetical protein CQY20_30500 [Mycolicibacterium agri]GFG51790.1 membrane protein [Mycolicibacterium agri]
MKQRLRHLAKWALLIAVTIAVTVGLDLLSVPSAALFAGLVVGIALALPGLAPKRVPRLIGLAAQGVLGVYIGTMVHRDALSALAPDWQIVVAVAVATLLISILAGALLGLHRDVSPLTGSLALVAGGASGLVAIARELGGDDRVVAVVQYLRVALVTASMPVVVAFIYHADRHEVPATTQTDAAPWYLSLAIMTALIVVGAAAGKLVRLPGGGLLGPLALTVALQISGLPVGLWVPSVLVQAGYMLIGWQAGVVFTRESLRAVSRMLPAAILLIVILGVATAGLGMVLAEFTGKTPLEGYLATSPGGVYAVLAIAAETGSGVTFIIAAQVFRVLLMLFTAPFLARTVIRLTERRARRHNRSITDANKEPVRAAD